MSAAGNISYELARSVFITGFMGVGKTTVARKLARICGCASIDMDAYLERREGRSIAELFTSMGEAAFRELEQGLLRDLAAFDPLFISCGGGTPTVEESRKLMRKIGYVVYLHVEPDQTGTRIHRFDRRPLLRKEGDAERLATEREPLYREAADSTIEVATKSTIQVAYEVRDLLIKEQVLCPRQN